MTIPKTLLAASLVACFALPGATFAQPAPDDGPMPPAADSRQPPDGPRDVHPGHPPFGPGGRHHPPRPSPLWETAGTLAAAEAALGITPEQEGAWRSFASAMIAFAEAGRPDMPPPSEDGAPSPEKAPDEAKRDPGELRGVRMFQRFVQSRVRQGEAAAKLSTALDGLAAVLTPEQVRIADHLLSELPHPGPHGDRPHDGGPHDGGPRPRD